MTTVEIVFRYATPPTEAVTFALAKRARSTAFAGSCFDRGGADPAGGI